MKTQRHNWLSYLVIFSIVVLPFQLGQAAMISDVTQNSYKCMNSQSDMSHEHHANHLQQVKSITKVCDSEHKCTDHNHCVKCNMDRQPVSSSTVNYSASNRISYQPDNYFEYFPYPELHPPQA